MHVNLPHMSSETTQSGGTGKRKQQKRWLRAGLTLRPSKEGGEEDGGKVIPAAYLWLPFSPPHCVWPTGSATLLSISICFIPTGSFWDPGEVPQAHLPPRGWEWMPGTALGGLFWTPQKLMLGTEKNYSVPIGQSPPPVPYELGLPPELQPSAHIRHDVVCIRHIRGSRRIHGLEVPCQGRVHDGQQAEAPHDPMARPTHPTLLVPSRVREHKGRDRFQEHRLKKHTERRKVSQALQPYWWNIAKCIDNTGWRSGYTIAAPERIPLHVQKNQLVGF